jgi:hypothetical protein
MCGTAPPSHEPDNYNQCELTLTRSCLQQPDSGKPTMIFVIHSS